MGTSSKGLSGRPNKTKYKRMEGWRKLPNAKKNREQRRAK